MAHRNLVLAAAALAGVLASFRAHGAEDRPAVAGDWVGVIEEGGHRLRIAVHLRLEGEALAGVVDSPDQGAFGLPLANIQAAATGFSFDLPSAQGRYEAQWDPARQVLTGDWRQSGATLPLTLKRGGYPFPFSARWDAPPAPGLAYTPAKAARPRVGPTVRVGKCVNISGMLDAPTETAWGPPIADDDFTIIKAAGFSTVRLPVAFSRHAADAPPYGIDPVFLARVRQVVG
ncbi:MAG: cellulase family glycosylhydrolase, partial [Caulobacter sp.]|nr:cellulase family glycosylhydrolase [Caulobacter sp.]